MKVATKFSFLVLEYFFQSHPERFSVFCTEQSNLGLWEEIFEHFFQVRPEGTEIIKHPLTRRAGSNDPKWDTLFISLNALKAQRLIIKIKRREMRNSATSLQEAA